MFFKKQWANLLHKKMVLLHNPPSHQTFIPFGRRRGGHYKITDAIVLDVYLRKFKFLISFENDN